MQEAAVQQLEPVDLAESLNAFLTAAEAFDVLFHQASQSLQTKKLVWLCRLHSCTHPQILAL